MEERHIRKYKERPARVECKVRYQLTVGRNQVAIERMLQAFGQIDLLVIPTKTGISTYLSQLTPVQARILDLLDLPHSLYTDLQTR